MIRRNNPSRWTTISNLIIVLLSMSSSRDNSNCNTNITGRKNPSSILLVVAVQDLENLGHCQKSGCRDSGDGDANDGDAATRHHANGIAGGGGKKYSSSSSSSSSSHHDDERRSAFVLFVEFVCVVLLAWMVLSASGLFKANDDGGRGTTSSSLLPALIVHVGAMVDRIQRMTRRAIGAAFDSIGTITFALWSSFSNLGRFFGGDANIRGKGRMGGGLGGTGMGRRVPTAGIRRGYLSQDSVASLGSLVDLIGTSDDHDSGFFSGDRNGANDVELGRVATIMTRGANDHAVGPRPRMRRIPSNASSIASSSCHSFDSRSESGGSSTWSMDSASTDGTDDYSSDDDAAQQRRASWNTSDAVVAAEEEKKKPSSTRVVRRRRRRSGDSEGQDTILSKFVGYLSSGRSVRGKRMDPPPSSSNVGRRRSLDGDGRRRSIDARQMLHHRRDGEICGGGGGIVGDFRAKRRSTLDDAPPSHDMLTAVDPIRKMYAPKSGRGGVTPHHEQTSDHHEKKRPGPMHWPRQVDSATGGAVRDNLLDHQQHRHKEQQQKRQLSPSKSDDRQDDTSASSRHPRHRHLASGVGDVSQTLTLEGLLGQAPAAAATDCGKSVADSMTEVNLSSIA